MNIPTNSAPAPALTTLWDALQQIIRIGLYIGGSALVTAGYIDEATSAKVIGLIVLALNAGWTWYWNRRSVATVGGLASAAVAVGSLASAAKKVKDVKRK